VDEPARAAAAGRRARRGAAADRWSSALSGRSLAALELTIGASLLVALRQRVMGTLIAYVLVRDDFRGKRVVNALIDLPFALPTIVAGLTLLALYGPRGPDRDRRRVHEGGRRDGAAVRDAALRRPGRPAVLIELDREVEEAAASLGARPRTILRRIVLPTLWPAIVSAPR
jgi:sulfate transport system permease protein